LANKLACLLAMLRRQCEEFNVVHISANLVNLYCIRLANGDQIRYANPSEEWRVSRGTATIYATSLIILKKLILSSAT